MNVVEHNGRLWVKHDEKTDPYWGFGPQPTNVLIVRDKAIEEFIALVDNGAGEAMERCKLNNEAKP